MSNAKNHHLIPKTYMKSWLTRKEKLLVKYCDEYDIVHEEKRENVGGIKHYYSIMAGMPICNEKDAELIFCTEGRFITEIQKCYSEKKSAGRPLSIYVEDAAGECFKIKTTKPVSDYIKEYQ